MLTDKGPMSTGRRARNLAISPNLDALLEHEERVHGSIQIAGQQDSQDMSSPVSPGNLNVVGGGGLRPPPRGNRQDKTVCLVDGKNRDISGTCGMGRRVAGNKDLEEQVIWSSSTTNPFINPAPTAGELELGQVHGKEGRCTETASQQSKVQVNIVDLFSDELGTKSQRLSFKTSASRRFRKPRKPRNHMAGENASTQVNRRNEEEGMIVLDIRRSSTDCIDITAPECCPQSRPLYSHARSSSCSVLNSDSDRPSFSSSDRMLLSKSPSSSSEQAAPLVRDPKKPLTPKPIFSIPISLKPSRSKSPLSTSPILLPPTTNFLDMTERTDLVKKSRKLTRLLGETPDGDMLADSLSRIKLPKLECSLTSPGLEHTPRRHSIPITPDELFHHHHHHHHHHDFLHSGASNKSKASSWAGGCSLDFDDDAHDYNLGWRGSFIDLSDEEDLDAEAVSPITFAPNPVPFISHLPPSPNQLSLYDAMTPGQRSEEKRRRNREKLAKLHRFLGSRVPADLVLGLAHPDPSLPPIQIPMPTEDTDSHRQWLRRRHSSSAGALPSWSDDIDRMKEDLNDKEKAINVRRAQKMEKMFGVPPPQTLYHTRHSPSPSVPPEVYFKRSKSPPRPSFGGFIPPGEIPSPTYQQRNPNRSSYIKQRPKKTDRPSTSESSRRLLPEGQDCYNYNESPVFPPRSLLIYHHYQHSLKSLGDILDRDDKESLAELHQYLNDYEDIHTPSSPLRETTPLTKDRRHSNASTMKSERRRSLPARTSILSLASEYSITTPKPEVSEFQVRRRRAAKLTQFFGVNYRELINDVLESLETGLEHERKRGTLRAEELEDLLERLRKIKITRKGFF